METTMIQSIPELGRTAAQVIPPHWYVVLASILFGIGVLGVLFRKNAIIIFQIDHEFMYGLPGKIIDHLL